MEKIKSFPDKSKYIVVENEQEVEFLIGKGGEKGLFRSKKGELTYLPYKQIKGFKIEKRKRSKLSDHLFGSAIIVFLIIFAIAVVYENLSTLYATIVSILIIGTVSQYVLLKLGSGMISILRSEGLEISLQGDLPEPSLEWMIPLPKDEEKKNDLLINLQRGIEG